MEVMSRTEALALAKAKQMPVAVMNRWWRYDVAWPCGETTQEHDADTLGETMQSCDHVECLVVSQDGTQTLCRVCPGCGSAKPVAEYEHVFYCPQSEGMESETLEECGDCRRILNEIAADKAAGGTGR